MKAKSILVSLIACLSLNITSQTTEIPTKKTQFGFGKIDFLSIKMPANEANMGYTGAHYNLKLNDWFYTGVGLYGAVTGIRGGFFTLGVNAGIKSKLTDELFLDTGFHFGAGGGASAPDGGGAFILPHVNLGYQFKNFSLQTGWSYVNFFDGGLIKSHQLNFGLEFPINFSYTNYAESEKEFSYQELKGSEWNQKSTKNSILLHLNNYKISGNTKQLGGAPYNGETIRLAGFEFTSYLTNNLFGFLKVDGAYHGIKAGFMDVFLGGGYHYSFNQNRTAILAKFAIGAAGGGGIDTGGGLLLHPDISVEQKLFDDVFIAINKGYVFSPNGNVNLSSYGVGIKHYLERDGIFNNASTKENGIFKGLNMVVKQDFYSNAKRDGKNSQNLYQLSLQINLDISKKVYLAGQTSFANFGDAGAYAEGLVGLGLKTNPAKTTSLFAQVLGGAAGGGDISTGQGFIVKPSAGINYNLVDNLSLRGEAGYVKATGGNLSNVFASLGLQYQLSILRNKK